MESRDFKGVWIDKSVWLDDRLNAVEKVILVEIDSLCGDNGCYASNEYLANFCQCSVSKVSHTISKLSKLGYISANSFDGRKRVLQSRLAKNARQACKICKADTQNLQYNNIYNNKANNKDNNIYEQEFAELWKLYPKKKGKQNALRDYIKARKGGTTFEAVKHGIESYIEEIAVNKTEIKYVKDGSTFFHQNRWEDDFITELQEVKQNDNMGENDKEYLDWLDSLERR